MKVTLNWLKQYVDFDWSPEQLTERLTMLGLEVEGVQKVAGDFEGVVVAQILTKDKVPGSDKLSVCKVNDGKGERTIICGAQNHSPGDKVPLILPNFALPMKAGDKEPFVIKERKVFGITSQGMMCSPQELGLPDQVDGLLLLPADAPIGKPFAEYLGRSGSDVVYDLEITPNRPDWNSVIGIAREISALTGNPLKLPEVTGNQCSVVGGAVADLVAVRVEDPELCPRYTARVIRGVRIGPSPDWLRSALEKVGVRSISNVVDVTNFVMLESGQPLHAFDYHLIAKGANGTPTIVVRRAAEGEKFTTLDKAEHTLTSNSLLIADESKGIALAGVMGGANTGINEQTVDVLIESAYFQPTNIRRTSKALGLRSDSSYRFERGCDPNWGVDFASRRACQLILETAGGQVVEGAVDVYPNKIEPKTITLRHEKVAQLLGIQLPAEQIECHLASLGLKPARKARPVDAPVASEPTAFTIPTFRADLKAEVDLVEEVARLHGVDKIPSTPPRGAIGANEFDGTHDQIADARRLLAGMGLNEACGQTLVGNAECGARNAELVRLANPLSSDMDVLRPSLLPGLLNSLRHNVSRKNYDVALFEVGRVFLQGAPGTTPPRGTRQHSGGTLEERRVAIAITGQRNPLFWSGDARDAKFDAGDLKGIVEEFLEQFGLRGVGFARRAEPTDLFIDSAAITLGGKLPLGELGQVSPLFAKRHDLRDPVFLAEMNLDQLLARRNAARSFKALPQFPSIRRDIAMLVPEATTHDAVLNAAKQAKAANLETVELFDVFRGKNIPAGQKSVAYAFTYRAAEKTLTDTEVNAAHEKIVEQCKRTLQAAVRE
jgi:phenylalanyl-tRNA synthetase beta chain